MEEEKRRLGDGVEGAWKKGGGGPSPDRDRAARARSPAAASGTASPSATAAGLVGTIGNRAAQRRGRSPANARISGTVCRRTPPCPARPGGGRWFSATSGSLVVGIPVSASFVCSVTP